MKSAPSRCLALFRQITNRFDYGIHPDDQAAYRQVMAQAATLKHVWWVVNNPYEVLFISQ